ncbi:MAG TPA: ABC transporter permease [Vicinamibacterales bacterium]|nr:ABC transporter permease [Vicinamibacterales bacterium]
MRASLLASTRRVFELALGQMLWARRTAVLALAAAAPVLLALVTRLTLSSGSAVVQINGRQIGSEAVFSTAIAALYLRFIVPAIGVFYGTSLIADEVEDRTITYLFVRPIPRGAIVLGKYLAYLLCVTSVVLPSAAVVFMVMVPFQDMAPQFGTFVRHLGVLALGLAAYGAVFLWAGVLFRRPLVGGLLFVFGWEQLAAVLPGYLGRFTIAHYLQADTTSVAALLTTTIAALWLAMRTIERREYVVER